MVPNSGKVELGDTCFTDASQGVQRPLRAKAKGNQCQLAAGLQPRYSRTKRKEDDKDGLGLRHSCFCAFFTPPFCLIYDFMYNGAQSPRTCRRVLCAVSRQHERSDFPSQMRSSASDHTRPSLVCVSCCAGHISGHRRHRRHRRQHGGDTCVFFSAQTCRRRP